MLSVHWTGIQN